ncbi:B9 protein [Ancylostoma caninum]|uniref:B9 domain-containing protein 2 n=1 Tax=Ancylostoma caninum TaxID=29170 RepID=A0A368GTI7_ANCCA|nr:B9 protein [Ancylostoma caninum]
MAEVYISGQIESADGFGDNRVCCRWSLQTGGGWRVVEGAVEGQTQTDLPSAFEEAYFAHPIDLHLATKTIQGKLLLTEVGLEYNCKCGIMMCTDDRSLSDTARCFCLVLLVSMSRILFPPQLSYHRFDYVRIAFRILRLVCNIWRPKGTAREEMMQRFVGGGIQVTSLTILEDTTERMRISTVAMGRVRLRLYVITRHFEQFGILS